MTTRGKIVFTIVILAVVGFGMFRWWDKIAPKSQTQTHSINVDEVKKAVKEAQTGAFSAGAGFSSADALLFNVRIQENNLFDAQLNESATQTQTNIAVVNLFKALGGGWDAQ